MTDLYGQHDQKLYSASNGILRDAVLYDIMSLAIHEIVATEFLKTKEDMLR